jgi:hypothetical protein
VTQKQSPIITAQGKQAGTNHVLRGLHQVLTYEKVSHSHHSPSRRSVELIVITVSQCGLDGFSLVRHERDLPAITATQAGPHLAIRPNVSCHDPGLWRVKLTLIRILSPKLYFVKMDITAAFDSIKQDKMLEVVSNFLDKVS